MRYVSVDDAVEVVLFFMVTRKGLSVFFAPWPFSDVCCCFSASVALNNSWM